RVVAPAPDLVLDVANLVGADDLAVGRDGDGVMAVLLDDRDHGLARHVSAADQDVGLIELRGVQELAPAHLGAVEVRSKKYLRHYLSTSTLRISRSKPTT